MPGINTLQYDDVFVQTNVDFGNEMSLLRKYRDNLTQQYQELSLKKMGLLLTRSDTTHLQVQMDELARTKRVITDQIDELMSVQSSYLRSCTHAS
jgi:DNA integrity scanning protein DisA with diadenylate cyclase activity